MFDTEFWGPIVSRALFPVITIAVLVAILTLLKRNRDQKLDKINSLKKLIWSLDTRVFTNSLTGNFDPPLVTNNSVFSETEIHKFKEELTAELASSNFLDEDGMYPDAISTLIHRYAMLCGLSGEFTRLGGNYNPVLLKMQGKPHDMITQDYNFLLGCTDLWQEALTRFHDSVKSISKDLENSVSWNPFKKCKLHNLR